MTDDKETHSNSVEEINETAEPTLGKKAAKRAQKSKEKADRDAEKAAKVEEKAAKVEEKSNKTTSTRK